MNEFKYLGVTLEFMAGSLQHKHLSLFKVRLGAKQSGKPCPPLLITDFNSLRTYLFSFLVSQLHSTQLVIFARNHTTKY